MNARAQVYGFVAVITAVVASMQCATCSDVRARPRPTSTSWQQLYLTEASVTQPWGDLQFGQRIIVMGEPLSGKSTLAEKLTADAHRVLWFDMCGDYERRGRLGVSVDELARWPALLDDPHARIVVRPQSEDDNGLSSEALQVLQLCERAGEAFDSTGRGGRVLVYDEVGDYRRYSEGTLNRLFRRGRHYGLVPILVSQVATDFPLTSRRIASHVYCLAQSHDSELAALEGTYGKDFAARVRAWRHYEPPVVWTRKAPNPAGGIAS